MERYTAKLHLHGAEAAGTMNWGDGKMMILINCGGLRVDQDNSEKLHRVTVWGRAPRLPWTFPPGNPPGPHRKMGSCSPLGLLKVGDRGQGTT